FHLAHASSGQECIDLIPDFRPHLIFMDLSMPGMDGWETIRRIRLSGLTECEIAVISANAFEKNAYNDAGITTENFITKPVRLSELLDWIGRHLQLEWVKIGISPPPAPRKRYPPGDRLLSLGQQVELGYLRGILNELDLIEQIDGAYVEFVDNMRQLARQFQFGTMTEILREGLDGGWHERA
ncbi:MAG TPA: response regulator, partial [Burkholderiales bacterium]|nr:response regulator [Burkholderiales bacterium]